MKSVNVMEDEALTSFSKYVIGRLGGHEVGRY
jgi:hypothetical protein